MKDMNFEVTNEKGEKINCQVLHTFVNNDINYMIYTDNEKDEDGNIEVLATRYTLEGNTLNLEPLINDEEWDLVDKEWSKVYEDE